MLSNLSLICLEFGCWSCGYTYRDIQVKRESCYACYVLLNRSICIRSIKTSAQTPGTIWEKIPRNGRCKSNMVQKRIL